MKQKREKVGKISTDLLQKKEPIIPSEQAAAMLTDWDKNMLEAINAGLKKYHHDFYIVVETKKERLMQNIIRNFFFTRVSCPTPNYDQTVFKYHYKDDLLEFLWVIPARDICHDLRDNALFVPVEHKELLQFVLDFDDGTLFKKCKLLNGEEMDSPILAKE